MYGTERHQYLVQTKCPRSWEKCTRRFACRYGEDCWMNSESYKQEFEERTR